MIYPNDYIHGALEKIAASAEDRVRQDAESYFKFQTLKDAKEQRSGVKAILDRRIELAKGGGIRGWFAKKSISALKKDVKSFDRMISYGQKHGYR